MDVQVHPTAQRFVSLHAVTRYCERFLNVNIEKPAGISPWDLAAACCAAAGTTIEAVQERLYTPIVRHGVKTGAPYFAAGGVGYKVSRDGVIVTVVRPHVHDSGPVKVISDAEWRRRHGRLSRRQNWKEFERKTNDL